MEWQIGDLALCINDKPNLYWIEYCSYYNIEYCLPQKGRFYTVEAISYINGVVGLLMEGIKPIFCHDGDVRYNSVNRFVKIPPPDEELINEVNKELELENC